MGLLQSTQPGGFGIAVPAELKEYAARIPAIDLPRQLFAAVLFPVVPVPPSPMATSIR